MWLLVSWRLLLGPLVCLSIMVLLVHFYENSPASANQQQSDTGKHQDLEEAWLVLGATNQTDKTSSFISDHSEINNQLESEELSSNQESFISNSSAPHNGQEAFVARREDEPKERIRRLAHLDRRPILNEFSFPANLVQGMRFVLMCQVLDGDLPIQIKWFKDQQELQTDSSSSQLRSGYPSVAELEIELLSSDELGSSLLFRKVQEKHSGNYTCLAKNHQGSTSFSSSLSVKIPPKWRIEPQDQAESIIGEQATIDCQADGNPNPFIRWKFSPIQQQQQQAANSQTTSSEHQNGHLMASPAAESGSMLQASSFKLINSNHHVQTLENGSLAIRLVNKDDEGFYQCEADNGLEPSLSKVLRLIVHQQAQIIDDLRLLAYPGSVDSPVASMNPPGSIVIKSVRLQSAPNATSQPLRVLCQANGDLPLTVDWLKDDQLIYSHTILISETSASISGAASSTSVDQLLGRLQVNTRRSGTRPQTVFESELYLTGLRRSDAGTFACSVRNAFGRNERRMKLILQEPPEPPEVVDVGHIGSRSIGLRWLPSAFDGNSPILKYIVEYRRSASHADPLQRQQQQLMSWPTEEQPADKMDQSEQSTGRSERIIQQQQQPPPTTTTTTKAADQQPILHTVHDLEPLARYSMRVIAVNAVGRSRPSVALTLRTEEEVPSVIPTHVGAIVLGSRSIKLHWTLNYSPEREIVEGFFIGYRSFDTHHHHHHRLEPAAALMQQADQPSSTGQPSLPDQQPTFTYKTVHLKGSPGLGGAIQHRLQQDPNPAYISPLSSATKSSGLPQTNNLPQQQLSQQQVLSSTFEYIIGGLERNTEYSIQIQCFNKKGAGPASDSVIFKTFANDPPEKLALSADEISESSVRVNWRFLLSSESNQIHEKYQLVDGFVLAFAKLIVNYQRPLLSSNELTTPRQHQPQLTAATGSAGVAAARIAADNSSGNVLVATNLGQQPTIDQWQAIQLAPQQRSHQLKNLECGTSYAMKIWAFNKIGKGEPSDLVTVSTRGKAPIAPDRRSFLSINSTQVRLHLSAWYDGGCEIDKFTVQYKVRGQHEWNLVSNNILREQLSVVIRDLSPASSYELLVGAQNQVGLTEVKYRFLTLDLDGKQVPSVEANSFASSSSDDSELALDYSSSNEPDGTRRELWPNDPNNSIQKSIVVVRQFMNSPLVLVLSLCFFVAFLMVLIFYKFNSQSSQPSPSVSTLNLSSNNSKYLPGRGSSGGGCGGSGSGEPILMSHENELHGAGSNSLATMSGSGCTTTDSPARLSTFQQQSQHSIRLLNSTGNNYSPAPESCLYQPFCNSLVSQQQQQQANNDYSHYGLPSMTYEAAAAANLYAGLPAQRNATMDQVNQSAPNATANAAIMMDQDRSRQLIQMLMLQGHDQNQTHLDRIPESLHQEQNGNGPSSNYAAAALTTMARGASNRIVGSVKLPNQQPFQANSLGRQSSNNFLEQTRQPVVVGLAANDQVDVSSTDHYPMSTFRVQSAGTDMAKAMSDTVSCISESQVNSNSATCSTATSSTSGRGISLQDGSEQDQATTIRHQHQMTCDKQQCNNLSAYDVPYRFNAEQNTSSNSGDDGLQTVC